MPVRSRTNVLLSASGVGLLLFLVQFLLLSGRKGPPLEKTVEIAAVQLPEVAEAKHSIPEATSLQREPDSGNITPKSIDYDGGAHVCSAKHFREDWGSVIFENVVHFGAVFGGEKERAPTLHPALVYPQVYRCPAADSSHLLMNYDRVKWYSQSHEDQTLFCNFFAQPHPKRQGIFVEMGAMDGVTFSNTKFFEDVLDWRGILIEAVPEQAQQLRMNRPGAAAFGMAVCKNALGNMGFLGRDAETKMEHLVGPKDRTLQREKGVERVEHTLCTRLGNVLNSVGITHIDLFSLDVEGSELEVLETMDWTIPVKLWVIENNSDKTAVRDLLAEHGYIRNPGGYDVRRTCTAECSLNEVYANPHYEDQPFALPKELEDVCRDGTSQ